MCLFYVRFHEQPQGPLPSRQRDVQRLELPAPFAARIEGERHLPCVARCNRLCVKFERRASAAAPVGGDGHGTACVVGQPEAQHGDFAGPEASETHGVRASRGENRIR